MPKRDEIWKEKAKEIEEKSGWDCGIHEHSLNEEQEELEHAEQCVKKMLGAYAINKDNYVVDGATISCSYMTNKAIHIKFDEDKTSIWLGSDKPMETTTVYTEKFGTYEIKAPMGAAEVGKLRVIHGESQTDNGKPFATVIERSYLRMEEKKEETSTSNENKKACGASIVSCGNCKKLQTPDILHITRNWDKAKRYGTCYCLIKPDEKWINPFCMESVTENCENEKEKQDCAKQHHHTMKFSTTEGEQEGLTMMSTLLCMRGGVITVEWSGQSSISLDERYVKLLEGIDRRKGRIEEYKIDFILSVFPSLLEEEKRSGIPVEVLFAQICTESGYGEKAPGNNYFGIKGEGSKGSVNVSTTEEIDGEDVSIKDDFRAYGSMEESIEDHTDLLLNVYKKYVTTGTVEDWIDALIEGGYATDSNYKEELMGVCSYWGLMD